MKLHINGEDTVVPDSIRSVNDLLGYFHLENKQVMVEHNREVLQKQEHETTTLSDGDHLEIVRFVGGG